MYHFLHVRLVEDDPEFYRAAVWTTDADGSQSVAGVHESHDMEDAVARACAEAGATPDAVRMPNGHLTPVEEPLSLTELAQMSLWVTPEMMECTFS